MTTQPDELKTFIDALQQGDAPTPTSLEEETLSELMSLGQSFTLDERFDHMLHQKFKKPQTIKSPKPAFLRRMAAVLAVAVLGLALVFAVPDMRAIAQSIIESLFPVAESDQVRADEYVEDVVERVDTQFYETFEAAQTDVPFAIVLPDRGLLDEYPYESYSYNADIQTAYVQYFEGEFINNRRDGNAVTIQQQPLWKIASGVVFGQEGALAAVGPDANIQHYTFGEGVNDEAYEGQWVKGMWTQNENPAIEADYIWRTEFPIYRLRWQDETYIYEVKFFGRLDTSALDFVLSLAESMMSDGAYNATQFALEEGSGLGNRQVRYFDTTDELKEVVDIDIMDLSFLPETYVMEQVVYDVEGRTAIVVYALQYANSDAIQPDAGLSMRQQRLEEVESLGTFGDPSPLAAIGPAAELQTIQIGDFQAEWVQGSWVTADEDEFNWINDIPVYRIRWQDDAYIYEMNFWFNAGQSSIDDVMLNMAESIAENLAAESE
ncbi:MAG: hypothetical protein CL607_27465 [Anaerolineaceae bacterium]|nr:hypothetical protein [Anaerolineaceae bacterium]